MRVVVKGQGVVDLHRTDFVAQGGEASVYRKGSRGFKIYTDPSHMIPAGKLQELGRINDPHVIKPEAPVFDARGTAPVGYTMRFVDDTWALCQVFPRAFRDREGMTPQNALSLVQALQRVVGAVHAGGALAVDLNEMNALVQRGFGAAYLIDVDSYQTPSYPATALMDSVRDWTVAGHDWTTLSDWYSFGVLAFQIFTGIHPYKGRHPSVKGFEARCRARLSVFNPDVRVPHSALPVSMIPDGYRAWFRALFEEGKRLPPPVDGTAPLVVAPVVRVLTGSISLVWDEVFAAPAPIQAFTESGGSGGRYAAISVAGTTYTPTQAGRRPPMQGPPSPAGAVLAWTPLRSHPLQAWRTAAGQLALQDLVDRTIYHVPVQVDALAVHDGRIYLRSGGHLLEVCLHEGGGNLVPTTRVAARVLPHATHLDSGVAVQNLLGSVFVSLFPASGVCPQVRVPELDAYRVVEARFDRGVLMVLGVTRAGQYDRLVFRFDASFQTYDLRTVADVTPAGLNFITLDSGVMVCLTEEEKLELTPAHPGASSMRVIEDPILGGDMRLVCLGGRAGFVRDRAVYSLTMR